MKRKPQGRLELTWMGKDSALIPVEDGKYDYAWVDPADPRAREVKSIEVVDHVGDVDKVSETDGNLLIVGDSGDALRSLGTIPEYADKYLGKVKLVYIDPPFNTEQTFEHYADQLEHSIWLTMMRDRIRDIKPLLSEDASVWVHLDGAEVHRMRVLMDEELGPENYVTTVAWRCTDNSSNNTKTFSNDWNSILVYGAQPGWLPKKLPDIDKQSHYRNPNNDPRGPWFDGNPVNNPNRRDNLKYDIVSPSGNVIKPPTNGWRWEWATVQEKMSRGEVFFNSDETSIKRKTYLNEQPGLPPSDIWFDIERTGSSRQAKNHLKSLFPGIPTPALFDTPKPEKLLYRILETATEPGDLVLDFFAGSGTTGATAQKMSRRWIMVELQQRTVDSFTIPRMTKVVEGKDDGGVSRRTTRSAVSELPEGVTPKQAREFGSILAKFDKHLSDLDKATLKALKDAAKTKDELLSEPWLGGGGFTVARMGPSMYEVDDTDGDIFLSVEATNGAWSRAVAGQLRFTVTPDHPVFVGRRNRQRLAVIDGVADSMAVRTVVEHLGDKERAVIVAKGVLPDAEALLAELSPGSRIKKAPQQIFVKGTVK